MSPNRCSVIATDVRQKNVDVLRLLNPELPAFVLDLMAPPQFFFSSDILVAENVLYHLHDPSNAIAWSAAHVNKGGMFIASTCISVDDSMKEKLFAVPEPTGYANQAAYESGGSRPTLPWLVQAMKKHFAFVYVPYEQPTNQRFIPNIGLIGDAGYLRTLNKGGPSCVPPGLEILPRRSDNSTPSWGSAAVVIIGSHSPVPQLQLAEPVTLHANPE